MFSACGENATRRTAYLPGPRTLLQGFDSQRRTANLPGLRTLETAQPSHEYTMALNSGTSSWMALLL